MRYPIVRSRVTLACQRRWYCVALRKNRWVDPLARLANHCGGDGGQWDGDFGAGVVAVVRTGGAAHGGPRTAGLSGTILLWHPPRSNPHIAALMAVNRRRVRCLIPNIVP